MLAQLPLELHHVAHLLQEDENVKATVFLLDSKDSIIKKVKSAVTDSEIEVVYREGKDGINNLDVYKRQDYRLYSCFTI